MINEPFLKTYLSMHMDRFYASTLWADMLDNIHLYSIYDGKGQAWEVNSKLDYTPTQMITNHIQHLIKEEARFMFSRPPEITIVPIKASENEQAQEANKALCEELEQHIRSVLERSGWQRKLALAGRDCFIGKRVALKVIGGNGDDTIVQFSPALEFFHEMEYERDEKLTQIVFAHNRNNTTEREKQRIWVQTYAMKDGACVLNEAIYDGYGNAVETRREGDKLRLDYIPAYVITNDGLLGDCIGESDVAALIDLQDRYNRMTSDDQDALKFNMFPQRVFADASEDSLAHVTVAPGSLIDLQTDPAAINKQAKYGVLESSFNYDERFEHMIERLKTDMYELLSVPKATTEDYKGMGISGKAMRALYWPLITRCEEKWATWDTALKWMVRCIVDIDNAYGNKRFTGAEYTIKIDHLYPITDDEMEEQALNLNEVSRNARSIHSYINKWEPDIDVDAEIRRIATEKRLMEDAYMGAVTDELMHGRDSP